MIGWACKRGEKQNEMARRKKKQQLGGSPRSASGWQGHQAGRLVDCRHCRHRLDDGYQPAADAQHARKSNEAALAAIKVAIANAGYELGKDITLALDCAASEFYDKEANIYDLKGEGKKFTSEEFNYFLKDLTEQYPIVSIEDGLDESDWDGFAHQTKLMGDKVQLVGDDLFVTNTKILKRGIDNGIANSILIKFNQIGSLTETLAAIKMAKDAGFTVVISHRSGETEDATIADLAVGTAAGQIKTGSLSRSDRVAKYNQLLRIEEQLGDKAPYNGLKEVKGQ